MWQCGRTLKAKSHTGHRCWEDVNQQCCIALDKQQKYILKNQLPWQSCNKMVTRDNENSREDNVMCEMESEKQRSLLLAFSLPGPASVYATGGNGWSKCKVTEQLKPDVWNFKGEKASCKWTFINLHSSEEKIWQVFKRSQLLHNVWATSQLVCEPSCCQVTWLTQ